MTFQELQIGDYFRIPGMSATYVYRKANSSQCSAECIYIQARGSDYRLMSFLQPIRLQTMVIKLDIAEVASDLATKRSQLAQFFN